MITLYRTHVFNTKRLYEITFLLLQGVDRLIIFCLFQCSMLNTLKWPPILTKKFLKKIVFCTIKFKTLKVIFLKLYYSSLIVYGTWLKIFLSTGTIRVYCRVRPFLPGQSNGQSTVDYIGENGNIMIVNPLKQGKDSRRIFTFNKVFATNVTQGITCFLDHVIFLNLVSYCNIK